jgi:polysaccharide biosynthesis transport protein
MAIRLGRRAREHRRWVKALSSERNEQVWQATAGVDLEWVLNVLRRRGVAIVACVLLAGGAAFALASRQPKRYTATASLVFSNDQLGQQVAGLQIVGNSEAQQAQQNTDVKLVQLGDMAAKTAAQLGVGLTEKQVQENLSIGAPGESNIVGVAATAASPGLAAAIANIYTREFVSEQQNQNHQYYSSALALVEKQLAALPARARSGAAALALENRAQSLGVLAELRSGDVQVAQAAVVPTHPSSPRVVRDAAIGAILGLLVGLALAFLVERLDRRVREPGELESIYGLPLLGVVPESKVLAQRPRQGSEPGALLPASEADSFYLLRAHLRYFNVDRQLRTIMVASPAPGDGKTTIARHLAAAASVMGTRALLLEVDLRRCTLAAQMGIEPGPGLADVLIGAVTLQAAVQSIEVGPANDGGPMRRTLDVLVAGAIAAPNPTELLESRAMIELVGRLKATYDLIVIDTPPLTAVSDAFPLIGQVDGVIVVGRLGSVRRDAARRLHQTLDGAGAPLLGVVANGYKARRSDAYGYGYGYGSDQRGRAGAMSAPSSNGASAEQPLPTV